MSIPNRLEKLRQKLAEEEIGGVLISQPENRRYLSGFAGSAGRLLITPESAVLATDFRYLEQAQRQAPQYEIFHTAGEPAHWFPELVSGLDLSRLGFEAGHIPFATYQEENAIAQKEHISLVPTTGLVESLRAIKEPEETRLISRAVELADKAITHIEAATCPGMSEQAVAWEVVAETP